MEKNLLLITDLIVKHINQPNLKNNTFKRIIETLKLEKNFSKFQLQELSNAYIQYTYSDDPKNHIVDGVVIVTETNTRFLLFESYTSENFYILLKQLILSELYYITLKK